MIDDLRNSLLVIVKLLEKHEVSYMIIGGTAVALNGYYRHSINLAGELTDKPDIDVWYNPSYENYYKILKVIEELGVDISEFQNEIEPKPLESFFRFDLDNFSIDFLPVIKANIKFSDANKRKEIVYLKDVPVYFISFIDLLEDKLAANRKKDLDDIEKLKEIRNRKNG
ncbi:RMD1 family protein [Bacteroidales bacterium OttesenSCG-928-B11]|nr:RMD1 family protein [Bacteroidales bacterium OttesenSCG-928-E04]MDL2309143.1 RMD1 family protein [Bacteroidales bacterium OttesenSCG-928-C03]MDL2312237.1 RMD1 family protein [Bacteroidales bacterium OttesenSCG-928-B11]